MQNVAVVTSPANILFIHAGLHPQLVHHSERVMRLSLHDTLTPPRGDPPEAVTKIALTLRAIPVPHLDNLVSSTRRHVGAVVVKAESAHFVVMGILQWERETLRYNRPPLLQLLARVSQLHNR